MMKCTTGDLFCIVFGVFYLFVGIAIIHKLMTPSMKRFAPNGCLRMDGYQLLENMFSLDEVEWLMRVTGDQTKPSLQTAREFVARHTLLNDAIIRECLLVEYVYNDYMFALLGSQIATCHRDYNGTMFQTQLNRPTYTMLIYLSPMKSCLDVVPGSHETTYRNNYLIDNSKHIRCSVGDVLVFDSNLIHTGSIINESEINPRLQMKLCHTSDREKLSFLEDYYKVLNDTSGNKVAMTVSKHLSCQYPVSYINNTMKSTAFENTFKLFAYGKKDALQIKDASPVVSRSETEATHLSHSNKYDCQ